MRKQTRQSALRLRVVCGWVDCRSLPFSVFSQLIYGPQQPARDEIQIDGRFHDLVAMTQGGREDASLTISVDPDDDVILFGILTVCLGKGSHGRPHLRVHVQFVESIQPYFRKILHDRVLGPDVLNFQVAAFFVRVGSLTHGLSPLVSLRSAIAVCGAMQHNCRHAVFMRLGNAMDERDIRHPAIALVMHDDIEAFRPV